MKLLHIIASLDPKWGGVSQALKTIIKGLNDFPDLKNEVVSFDDPDASFIKENPDQNHALGLGKGPWFYNKNYIPWLIQNLSKYDVVILHGLWNYQGYGLIKAFKTLSVNAVFSTKFFVMPHGMLDPYFQKASGRKLKALRNWFYWKLIEKNVVNKAAGLLFTCEAELQLARKTFTPYQPEKELVVGLGVEEPPVETAAMQQAFSKKCTGLNNKSYILFLSRIHEKKGVELLVQAFKKLRSNKSNDASFTGKKYESSKLVIAGPGLETEYGQKIKTSAQILQTPENSVFFPGMLTGDAKWGAFYNSEVFILPSHQENFGIAVVEALACGKPVLISDQVNIWTEIADSKAGIVAKDTLIGTEELLTKWNNLPKQQQQEMGKNARKCYEKHFAVKPAAYNFFKAISV